MTNAVQAPVSRQGRKLRPVAGASPEVTTGYPLDRLTSAFDRVRDAWDWKAPIEAVIQEEDRPLVEQAITWFTGTPPAFAPAPQQPGYLIVRAQGYGIDSTQESRSRSWHRGSHTTTGVLADRSQGLTEVSYKGFRIVARPYQVRPSKRWIVDLQIHRNGRHHSFTGERHAPSESDARVRCVTLGREIIDGRVPGWTVQPLRRFPTRPLHRTLIVIVLIGGLSAFGFARADSVVVLETVAGWVSTLAVIFGSAMIGHTAGGGQ